MEKEQHLADFALFEQEVGGGQAEWLRTLRHATIVATPPAPSLAVALVALPQVLLTKQRYWAASLAPALLMVNVSVAAPENVPPPGDGPSLMFWPLRRH